ncbi:MAG TPA: hypothetical protein VF297_12525 [Pyrinomonadaceae bacterium]
MSDFRHDIGEPRTNPGDRPSEDTAADLSSLFNYPSLGRLFEGPDTQALEDLRARLTRTNQDLERALRQGTSEDAARAGRAARAVEVTLALLEELEQLKRGGQK